MDRMVQTDMGSRAAQANGLEKAPVTLKETVQGITHQVCRNLASITCCKLLTLLQIEVAKKSTTSGQFVNYKGEKVCW
jgi:norsolorinic acid ketoreductase